MQKILLKHIMPLDNQFISKMCDMDYDIISGRSAVVEVEVPAKCPICGTGIDLVNRTQIACHDIHDEAQKKYSIFTIHSCPVCHKGFVVQHKMVKKKSEYKEVNQYCYPTEAIDLHTYEDIKAISPMFYKIYVQCLTAKSLGLDEIYGMGFRKAIEHLVTDFAIYENQNDREVILSKSLHQRIETYFSSFEGKEELMACKWLGNDETHYLNNNTEKDLLLLQDLIDDAVNYIHKRLRHQRAVQINDEHRKENKRLCKSQKQK